MGRNKGEGFPLESGEDEDIEDTNHVSFLLTYLDLVIFKDGDLGVLLFFFSFSNSQSVVLG